MLGLAATLKIDVLMCVSGPNHRRQHRCVNLCFGAYHRRHYRFAVVFVGAEPSAPAPVCAKVFQVPAIGASVGLLLCVLLGPTHCASMFFLCLLRGRTIGASISLSGCLCICVGVSRDRAIGASIGLLKNMAGSHPSAPASIC